MKTLLFFFALVITISVAKAQTGTCSQGTAYDSLNINNVNARVNSGGDMWLNLVNGSNGSYIVPKADGFSTLFAGSIWIGGLDSKGLLHIAANTYRQNGVDFFPGPFSGDSGKVTQTDCQNFDQIWKVTRREVNTFDSLFFYSGGSLNPSSIPKDILNWPGHLNPYETIVGGSNLAPFYDADNNGIYDPTSGDSPFFPGDEALFWVYNDAGNSHGETKGLPLDVEIHGLAFAYNSGGYIGNTTFYQFTFLNKSLDTLHSSYIGLWVDPESLCSTTSTFVGCDSAKSTVFIYPNSSSQLSCSGNYANKTPMMTIKIISAPPDSTGRIHLMDNFMTYHNDFTVQGNPQKPMDYYNYMRSIFTDGTHATYGGNGYGGVIPTNYEFSGNPANDNQWSMCSAHLSYSDSRLLLSCNAGTLIPGAVYNFIFSVTWDTLQATLPCPTDSGIISITDSVTDYLNSHPANAYYGKYNSIQNIEVETDVATIFPSLIASGNSFNISGTQINGIKIYDITGRIIASFPCPHSNTISVSTEGWAEGMYFCNISKYDGKSQTIKLIVQ